MQDWQITMSKTLDAAKRMNPNTTDAEKLLRTVIGFSFETSQDREHAITMAMIRNFVAR